MAGRKHSGLVGKMGVLTAVLAAGGTGFAGAATAVTLHLEGAGQVQRTRAAYQCDSKAVKLGLPAGVFSVEYLNRGANHLALVPLRGETIVFANVMSGSGARYAAGAYVWWEAGGRGVTLTMDGLSGKVQSVCHGRGGK